jgi:hypothetical protein
MNKQGNSSLLMYDRCAYEQYNTMTNSPFAYMTDITKFEHNKMKQNVPHPQDLTPAESELKGITRPASKCNILKYNPNCKRSQMCTSTFDNSNIKVIAPELFPIVYNNLKR